MAVTNFLYLFINEVADLLGSIEGIRWSTAGPPETVDLGPTALVYQTAGGLADRYPANSMILLDDVIVAVIMPSSNLTAANAQLLPLKEKIYEQLALLRARDASIKPSDNMATFGGVNHVYGPIEWPTGELFMGYLFTIDNVKIENVII